MARSGRPHEAKAGGFGSDSVPMRPARERDAAREAEERLRLVVRRSRSAVWVAGGFGLLVLLLALLFLLAP